MTDSAKLYMRTALELAREAEIAGEVPVGAVVVHDGEIIGRGSNRPIGASDPTAHAEIEALRNAANLKGNYRLPGATMYVTLEPCAMCAGAMIHARIEKLVFACGDSRSGAAGSVFNILQSNQLNHRVVVESGVLESECRDLLQRFFRERRGASDN